MTAILDWSEYIDTARAMAAEGCVLLIRRYVGADGLPLKEFVIRRKPDSEMSEEEWIIATRNEVI